MEKLKELIAIVNQIKTHRIEVMGKGRKRKGEKLKMLYDGIAKGKFKSDTDAAIAIYGKNYITTNYTSLKNNLTNRLINSIFFINLSEYQFNDSQKNYFEAHKQRSIINILMGKGAKGLSIDLAEKLIKKSIQYQFTEITFELAKILRRHYRVFNYKRSLANKYNVILKENLEILIAETEVEDYYEQLVLSLKNKRSVQSELTVKGKLFSDKTRLLFPKFKSKKLIQFANLIFVLEHELSQNYKAVESTCKIAISYYEDKFRSYENSLIFYIKLLGAYIPLKKFKEGKAIATKILDSILPNSINYFVTLEHYFLLSLHTGNYKKGKEILAKATSSKGFKKLDAYYKEMWVVYEAYIEYLKEAGILKKETKKNFRVARFMNQVPNFSRDKKGVNISILLIQVLLLIAQGKETKVIDRVESLRTYVYTHLRNDESLRSNIFIKMLLKAVESNFHKNGTIRRTKILRKKLEESPIGTKGYSQYVEIIPYEKLWEISLTFLSNRAF